MPSGSSSPTGGRTGRRTTARSACTTARRRPTTCSLRVVIRLPPGPALAALDRDLPLDRLVGDAAARTGVRDGVVHRVAKPDAEVVWVQMTFTDPVENRPALSRTCMARARGVQPLVAMDCWADMAAQFEPVWDHVMAHRG